MAGSHDKPKRSPVPNLFQRERHLKVSSALYEYKGNASRSGLRATSVPWIRMQGKWLEQAGFTIHTRVRIRVMKGCLVLTTD